MATTRLETENVRRILMEILNGMELYGVEGKDAEQQRKGEIIWQARIPG